MPYDATKDWAKAQEELVEALKGIVLQDVEMARLALQRAHYRVLEIQRREQKG